MGNSFFKCPHAYLLTPPSFLSHLILKTPQYMQPYTLGSWPIHVQIWATWSMSRCMLTPFWTWYLGTPQYMQHYILGSWTSSLHVQATRGMSTCMITPTSFPSRLILRTPYCRYFRIKILHLIFIDSCSHVLAYPQLNKVWCVHYV